MMILQINRNLLSKSKEKPEKNQINNPKISKKLICLKRFLCGKKYLLIKNYITLLLLIAL